MATFQDGRLPATGARLTNCYAVVRLPMEDEPGAYYLLGSAGLDVVCTTGGSPCAGMIGYEGTVIGVFGASVYKNLQTSQPIFIGTIAGTGPVTFARDVTGLVIQRDNTSAAAGNLWFLDQPTLSTLTQFTLPLSSTGQSATGADAATAASDTEVCSSVAELDNTVYYSVKSSIKMYASNQGDPTTILGVSFASKEARPDHIRILVTSKLTLYVFGQESLEMFYDAGIQNFPATRYENSMYEVGLLAKYSAVGFHNSIFFLASDKQVYRGQDINIAPVTPDWLKKIFDSIPQNTLMQATGACYTAGGVDFYLLTIPTVGTYEFNLALGLWTTRRSPEAQDISEGLGIYGQAFLAPGGYYLGDSADGTVYLVDEMGTTHDNMPIPYEMITASFGSKEAKSQLHYVDIDFNVGQATQAQIAASSMQLSYTDDECRSWSPIRNLALPVLGQTRSISRVFGWFRRRQLRITYSGPVQFRIDNIYMGMSPGFPRPPYMPGQG